MSWEFPHLTSTHIVGMVGASAVVGAAVSVTSLDQVPLVLGLMAGAAVATYQIVEKIGTLSHDEARRRLGEETIEHDATRKALAIAKNRIAELEAKLGTH